MNIHRVVRDTPFLMMIAFCACVTTEAQGNGVPSVEPRDVSGFRSIYNGTALDVVVSQGPAFVVRVRGDSNLLPLVDTSVVGTELRITVAEPLDFHSDAEVDVTMPAVDALA